MDDATLSAYLARLGLPADPLPAPSGATLHTLHVAHLLRVPFENLDIHDGITVAATEAWALDKVVRRGRGGFCYELNGAFAALLEALGFQFDLLSARVPRLAGGFGPPFDHMALRVHLPEGPMLADVGFGEGFREPLRFGPGEQQATEGAFRIVPSDAASGLDDGGLLVEQRGPEDKDWEPLFALDPRPRSLDEFAGMCHFHQTSTESTFTRKRLWSLALPDGRVTWSDGRLIETRRGQRTEKPMTEAELRAAYAIPP